MKILKRVANYHVEFNFKNEDITKREIDLYLLLIDSKYIKSIIEEYRLEFKKHFNLSYKVEVNGLKNYVDIYIGDEYYKSYMIAYSVRICNYTLNIKPNDTKEIADLKLECKKVYENRKEINKLKNEIKELELLIK